MIESISITNRVPFVGDKPHTAKARKINYIFGANGVGKTTISRIMDRPDEYPDGWLYWERGRLLQTLVLNKDFVDDNFEQLQGIFTLGEEQKDTREEIEQTRIDLQTEQDKRDGLKRTLEGDQGDGGKQAERRKAIAEFTERCWAQKCKHEGVFKDAFKGSMHPKEKLRERILAERQSNTSELKSYQNLVRRAETLFGEPPELADDVPSIHTSALLAHESDPVLSKAVIGKRDVDIAAMIERLGNVDWVRLGRRFYDTNDGTCPFCQQTTSEAFAESLEAYFDETYDADKRAIDDLVSAYETDAHVLQEQVDKLVAEPNQFLDIGKLQSQRDILDGLVRENMQLLRSKQEAPSQQIELQSLANVVTEIKKLIDEAKASVQAHNKTVRDFKGEKDNLKAEVWRFLLAELDQELKIYEGKKNDLDKAIKNLEAQVCQSDKQISEKNKEIQSLERKTTNIQSTVDDINAILKQFGFTTFRLAMSEDEQFYRLVRPNGDPAAETLSEGERTFVVFLYFYHLLRGSKSETNINTDRVVVIDDPVSSLDSDVLFIVSTLIRGVCEDVREGRGNIKQVFVLTHNVYFHREVTYRNGSEGKALKDESFWIVRKRASGSTIKEYRENPIKTSYELLWDEVREADPTNPGLGNAMRRILEYYFKVIGDTKLHELHREFEGMDKLLCHALLSWANAGSHHILEPELHVPSDASVEAYKRVFRQIFEKNGHPGHYRMMMGDESLEETE